MRKFCSITIAAITLVLLFNSCSKENVDTYEDSIFPEHIDEYSLYKATPLFAIYKAGTKGCSNDYLIKLSELPEADVLFNDVSSTKANDEENLYKTTVVMDGEIATEYYFSYEADETGYFVHYFVGDDSFDEYFPFNIEEKTKAAYAQHVSSCIDDAYSNHGWASIILKVESIVIPETLGAIAVACLVKCSKNPNIIYN